MSVKPQRLRMSVVGVEKLQMARDQFVAWLKIFGFEPLLLRVASKMYSRLSIEVISRYKRHVWLLPAKVLFNNEFSIQTKTMAAPKASLVSRVDCIPLLNKHAAFTENVSIDIRQYVNVSQI